MRQLGVVQFFSWFALFSMWVFTTPAVVDHVYHIRAGDTSSMAYNNAANWVNVCFGVYNLVSAIYALLLPAWYAKQAGRKPAFIGDGWNRAHLHLFYSKPLFAVAFNDRYRFSLGQHTGDALCHTFKLNPG